MNYVFQGLKKQGVHTVVFGDIFLEDIHKYRKDNLKKLEMTAIFPLWKKELTHLARDFINSGLKQSLSVLI